MTILDTTTDQQTDTWTPYVCDSYGFVLSDPEGVLTLIGDDDAISAKYGDCIPSEIVVARRSAAPKPQSPGSDTLRLPSTCKSRDHVSWDIEDESPYKALLLWRGAQGFADAVNDQGDTKAPAAPSC